MWDTVVVGRELGEAPPASCATCSDPPPSGGRPGSGHSPPLLTRFIHFLYMKPTQCPALQNRLQRPRPRAFTVLYHNVNIFSVFPSPCADAQARRRLAAAAAAAPFGQQPGGTRLRGPRCCAAMLLPRPPAAS
jgi:hypothetical protein